MNFAPNESFESYRYLGAVIRSLFSKHNEINISLENEILKNLFPNSPNASCISFFSGRSALYHSLQSLDLPPESEVIIQSFTCTAVVTPVLHARLTPVYCDINLSDFSANLESIKQVLSPRTKALILQYSFGITPIYRNEIIKICEDKGIFLIEDLAHGIDPSQFSWPKELSNHAVILSFGRSKLISSVFGATIISHNRAVMAKLESRRNGLSYPSLAIRIQCLAYKFISPLVKSSFSLSPHLGSAILLILYKLHLFPREIENIEKVGQFSPKFDFQLPRELASIILAQVPKLSTKITNIRNIVNTYRSGLISNFELAHPPSVPLLRFPIICESEAQNIKILEYAKSQGIHLGTWYEQVVAPTTTDLSKVKYKPNSCKVAEDVCKRIINLPLQINESFAIQINELLTQSIK